MQVPGSPEAASLKGESGHDFAESFDASAFGRVIMWAGALAIVATGLYPPWVVVLGRFKQPFGHHWIFLPPEAYAAEIDLPRLLFEWFVVVVFGCAFYFAWPNVAWPHVSIPLKRKHFEGMVFVILGPFVILFLAAVVLALWFSDHLKEWRRRRRPR